MLKARTSDSDESELTLRKPSVAARAGLKVELCTQEDYYEAPSRNSNSSATMNTTSPVQRQTFSKEAVFDLDADELHTLTDLKAGPSPAPGETSASVDFRKRAKDQLRFERVVEGRTTELSTNRTLRRSSRQSPIQRSNVTRQNSFCNSPSQRSPVIRHNGKQTVFIVPHPSKKHKQHIFTTADSSETYHGC